ncbi:MAG: YihA family ribosome biogenesis GTP-binding protein [Proteobacteria bacterium]|nr:YihA family ribosome biogenesis GTP-binding protein [Pseudomonadota bacterium]
MSDLDLPKPQHFDFSQIEFIKSSPSLAQSPEDVGIEVAFVGRSNAGKSSAINAIAGRANLARTSKTPGRTQLINFFKIDEHRRLVDLPGYGYAKVPQRVQKQLEEMLTTYLSQRHCLQGLMLLMDIRHPLMPQDKQLIHFANDCELPIHVLLTKCDKLKRGASQNTLIQTRHTLSAYPRVSVQTFSALHRFGLEEVHQKLDDWFNFDDGIGASNRNFS